MIKLTSTQGQTLLELVLALGLVIAVITAITITTTTGLKSTDFAKSQVQATKLAQDGLESIKLIKERNNTVCGPNTITRWNNLWTTTCNSANPCTYRLQTSIGSLGTCVSSDALWLSNATVPASLTLNGITYNRLVRVIDNGTQNRKEVIVEVSWSDSSGPHTITVSTILAEY